jgi:hypothetical protein
VWIADEISKSSIGRSAPSHISFTVRILRDPRFVSDQDAGSPPHIASTQSPGMQPVREKSVNTLSISLEYTAIRPATEHEKSG